MADELAAKPAVPGANDVEAVARSAFEQLWGSGRITAAVRESATARRAERYAAAVRASFPDFKAQIESVTVSGDTAVIRWTGRGTHLAPLLEVAPTGRRIRIRGVAIYRRGSGIIMGQSSL